MTSASVLLGVALDNHARGLLRELEPAGPPKKERVHRLRVATRRLLATLKLARAVLPDVNARTERRLKALLKVLSPLRDAQLQREALAALLPSEPVLWPLLAQLKKRTQQLRRKSARVISGFDTAALTRVVTKLSRALAAEGPGSRSARDAVLVGELSKKFLELEQRRQSLKPTKHRRLHRMRLVAKDYRYALEAIGAALAEPALPTVRALTHFQDAVGKLHDAHVLSETLRHHAIAKTTRHPRRVQRFARKLAHQTERRTGKLVKTLAPSSLGSPPLAPRSS
jgi:CHAD domain-containing protein